MVGGDAVATRRFLGTTPPLADLGARDGRPVIFLRDLFGAAETLPRQAAPWRIRVPGLPARRVSCVVLESDS